MSRFSVAGLDETDEESDRHEKAQKAQNEVCFACLANTLLCILCFLVAIEVLQVKGPDLPAEFVLWTEAQEFCEKARGKTRGKTGWGIRLPTEAEWEHACRAGTRTAYYTGDSEADLDRTAWYRDNSPRATHPVGQKTPNAWGLYDAHGNVWEWCSDWFEEYKRERAVDPQGPPKGWCHVSRGGSYYREPKACRSAFRGMGAEEERMHGIGFRVAASAPKAP